MAKSLKGILCAATLALAPVVHAQHGGQCNVFWTDKAPVLDGMMDDACWQAAEPISGFKANIKEPRKTEVRFAYDGANLYVFWKLHESDMKRVVLGEPEKSKDQFERQRGLNRDWVDAVEMQFYPGRSATNFLMFISSPLGARYDIASRGSWKDYDPGWLSVPGRFDGGWTLEQQIPFAELAQAGGGFSSPEPGDQWRIQLYRKKFSPPEVSWWGAGEPPPADYANFIFRGRKSGVPPSSVKLKRPDLFYGVGGLEFAVAGQAHGTCEVFKDGKAVQRSEGDAHGGALSLPLRLKESGSYRVRYELNQDGVVLFSGQEIVELAPLPTYFPKPAAQELAMPASLRPEARAIKERLEAFKAASQEAGTLVEREKTLSEPEWKRLAELRSQLVVQWPELRRDLALLALNPAPGQAFGVGAVTESDKLYPDTLYRGSVSAPVRLALAGGERGSFQLAVIPFWTDLKDVSVSFTALRGPDGKAIPADQLHWFRVGYVKLEEPRAWLHLRYEHPAEPDPLLPAAPFDVKAGTLAAIWVDVFLPPGTPEGAYDGAVKVMANGQTVERPLEVESYGFDIPRVSSVENEFWWTPDNWQAFYGGKMKYTPELHAKHAATLGRYRVSSFPCDWATLCPQVTIYAEPDGHFSFDWTTFDKYVKTALDNGTTAFWSALSCNSGWTRYLSNPTTRVVERATGKAVELGRYLPPMKEQWLPLEKLPYRENKVYREFLQAYAKHLKELGIADRSHYELFDEPGGDRFLEMLRHHQFFREVAPGLKLLDFNVDPLRSVDGRTAVGLMDTWAPDLSRLDNPEVLAAMRERRAKHGEKLWAYTCVEQNLGKDGKPSPHSDATKDRYSPFITYYRPYIAARIQAWMAWKFQLDGFYIFMMNCVPPQNVAKKPGARWPDSVWTDGGERGCGTLVYPGPDFEIVPSMRLANIREGLEDYEYFALLKKLSGKLDKDSELSKRVEAALEMDQDIVGSVFDWTKDRERLEAKRRQLAALIMKIKKLK